MTGVGVATGAGLIPAHAGKTETPWSPPSTQRAHPRSRGENSLPVKINEVSSGSSPLTRGKPGGTPVWPSPTGLIPAHAGKTSPLVDRPDPWAAHPRSRGENETHPLIVPIVAGSSPLTRGKHAAVAAQEIVGRLIPAHAGKTGSGFLHVTRRSAHPRSRGENKLRAVRSLLTDGSSPLTRGKPRRSWIDLTRGRLIPAHAGKTAFPLRTPSGSSAHPRSRGENFPVFGRLPLRTGSSPLTRGKQLVRAQGANRTGLIPAHAGKTCLPAGRCLSRRAHPRSRGENPVGGKANQPRCGSSPLTRGKLATIGYDVCWRGLIPAHAGKTP